MPVHVNSGMLVVGLDDGLTTAHPKDCHNNDAIASHDLEPNAHGKSQAVGEGVVNLKQIEKVLEVGLEMHGGLTSNQHAGSGPNIQASGRFSATIAVFIFAELARQH
jgi:hypothetical protein